MKEGNIIAEFQYYKVTDINATGISVNIDEAAMYEGNLTYFVHNYCSFELGVDYAKSDMDFKSSYLNIFVLNNHMQSGVY